MLGIAGYVEPASQILQRCCGGDDTPTLSACDCGSRVWMCGSHLRFVKVVEQHLWSTSPNRLFTWDFFRGRSLKLHRRTWAHTAQYWLNNVAWRVKTYFKNITCRVSISGPRPPRLTNSYEITEMQLNGRFRPPAIVLVSYCKVEYGPRLRWPHDHDSIQSIERRAGHDATV